MSAFARASVATPSPLPAVALHRFVTFDPRLLCIAATRRSLARNPSQLQTCARRVDADGADLPLLFFGAAVKFPARPDTLALLRPSLLPRQATAVPKRAESLVRWV